MPTDSVRHASARRTLKLIFIMVLSFAFGMQAKQPHLQKLVGIAAENGIVALDGNKLSLFSPKSIRIQSPPSPEWRLANKKSGAVSIRIDGTQWQEVGNALPLSTAYSFAFCDPLNQVDVGSTDNQIRLLLPTGSRLKSVVRVSDDRTLVVYSTSGQTVRYDLRVGVIRTEAPRGYSLTDEDVATNTGNFCGVQRGNAGIFYVFSDEPSGSSDFSAVYVYALLGTVGQPR